MERLVLRASTAADSKLFDEARAAIDEARLLWPAAPGLADIELRLPERPPQPLERLTQPEHSLQPERSAQQPDRSAQQPNRSIQRPRRSTHWKETAVAAAVTAFAAAGVFTAAALLAPALMNIGGDEDLSDGPTKAEATNVLLPAAVDARKAPQESLAWLTPARSETQRTAIEPDRDSAPVETPPARAAEHDEKPPAHDSAPVETPRATAGQIARGDTDPTAAPLEIPSKPISGPAIPVDAPSIRASTPLPAVWGAPEPPQEAPVRATLARYAAAYTDLNLDAAANVWPGVDRTALSRAFNNLKSQSISLGTCQIQVEGEAARARCLGSATWVPKVGGGERTDALTWNFELERSGASWQIVSARAQNR